MDDPVSIAGSVVGVVALGITVVQGLVDYYGAWKECGDEVKSTLRFLQNLSSTLETLQSVLNRGQGAINVTSHVEGNIQACSHAITKSDQKLQKIQTNGQPKQCQRMLHPFRKGTLGKLQDLVTELRDNLQLVLGVFQTDTAAAQSTKLDHIEGVLPSLDLRVNETHLDDEREKIHSWLHAPAASNNHAFARQKHEPRTGSWFLESKAFSEWMAQANSSFWLHGLRRLPT